MYVPFVDLPSRYTKYTQKLHLVLDRVLNHGQFVLGEEVDAFEKALAEFHECKYAVAVANGTDALVLALRSIGAGPGSEVITSPISYLASTSAIALTGATPVFVDVGEDLNIDPAMLERAITPATKAIVAVHVAGNPAQCNRLSQIAKQHNLELIEDCAQSIGASISGRMVGTFGTVNTLSFHPLKNLGALGDAGAILTNDESIATWLRLARNHGHSSREQCEFWSVNSRLDTLQAGFLSELLPDLPSLLTSRRAQANLYKALLQEIVTFPHINTGASPTYNMFMISTDRRDELVRTLKAKGVDTRIHYPIPIHHLNAAASLKTPPNSLMRAELLSKNILSLPIGEHISNAQIEYVVETIGSSLA